MTFTYTPEQAEAIAARWNELANDDNQISTGDVHHIFDVNAGDDIATDGATLIELRAMQSASGAPALLYVTRDEVTPETVSDILVSDTAARFDISTAEERRIASIATDGADFLRIWADEDWWRDDMTGA
jgi:hypothetical protein